MRSEHLPAAAMATPGVVLQDLDQLFLRRAALVDEVASIDQALQRVYERLAEDRPTPIPSVVMPLLLAEGATTRLTPERGTCAYDVLCGVTRGLTTPRALRAAHPHWAAERIKHALSALVDLGWVSRTGQTNQMRYTLRLMSGESRTDR